MTELAAKVIEALKGKTLSTAESCTGGLIGGALTAIPGSSAVYKGGVISYTNEIKMKVLGISDSLLAECGAVSAEVAQEMAKGVRTALNSDIAVSVTGLAGPGGDEFDNPVGTVYIGYADEKQCVCLPCFFTGDREAIRNQSVSAALALIMEQNG